MSRVSSRLEIRRRSFDRRIALDSLLTVLQHGQVRKLADERFLEALIANALNNVPAAGRFFGCGPKVIYTLGARGKEPDIIGTLDNEIVMGCEVKIRSNLNWSSRKNMYQLDCYAANLPGAKLFLLTTETQHRKLTSRSGQVATWDRWNILYVCQLEKALNGRRGRKQPIEMAVKRLIFSLARLRR